MSNERSLVFTGGLALQTAPGMARLVSPDHEDIDIPEPTLGMLAEWLAVAWVNVTGEEYEHQEVGVRVNTKEFTEILKRGAPMPGLDSLEKLERDCE